MGRAKIVMEPINNDKKRKTTFNIRKQGMLKKARELTVLCDVNVAMIISNDDHENPEIFPPDRDKLDGLIDLYRRNRCMDPGRVSFYGVSDYYMDRKIKMEEELLKTKKKNLEAKYPLWFDYLNSFSELQLREFVLGLENKIVDVRSRIEFVRYSGYSTSPVSIDYNNSVFVPCYGVESNMIMQSLNSDLMSPIMRPLSYPDSVMNMMLNEDDNVVYDGEGFSVEEPLMDDCFQPEFMQQFLVTDFGSQVNNARGNGNEIISYLTNSLVD